MFPRFPVDLANAKFALEAPAVKKEHQHRSVKIPAVIWRWAVQLWILATIIAFIVIRVFGSHLAQQFLTGSKHLLPR